MRLADEIVVMLGGQGVALRPCLRHALALFREHHPRDLAQATGEGSLTAFLAILRPFSDHPLLAHLIMEDLDALKLPCLRYLAACMGVDPDAPADPKPARASSAPPRDPEQSLVELFRLGAGWLGWTPAATLDATAAEIMEAYTGRLNMLKALFGTSDKADKPKDDRPLDEKIRATLFAFNPVRVEG